MDKEQKIIDAEDKAEQIKEIIDTFDFVIVQKVMQLMKWTYADDKESPSIDQLKKT